MTVATFAKAGLKNVREDVDPFNPLEVEKAAGWQAGIFFVLRDFVILDELGYSSE